jgi:hypothetical protein
MPKPAAVSWFASSRERLLFIIALAWSALVFSHYFPLSAIFDFSFLRQLGMDARQAAISKFTANLASAFYPFLWDAGVLITLWAWGRRIGQWIGLPPVNPALGFCLRMGLGIIFFNTLWLGTGLNGLWEEPFLLVLSLAFLGIALWDIAKVLRNFKGVRIPAWPTGWTLGLVFLGLAAWVLALAQGMVPEVYFDGLVYHLSVLKFWEYHHGITDFATNFHSYYPFGAELYFFNGFWEAGGQGAKILNASAMGLLALAAAGWVAEEAGAAWAWVTLGMVLTFPWISSTAWTTQNEIVLSFFILLFFYSSRRWAREKNRRLQWVWIILAGLLGGAALTVKYTAAPAFAAGFAALGFENRGIFRKEKIRDWFLLFLLFSAALLPWLIKNQIYTGDVLYPYFSQWLGGRSLSPGRFQELLGNHESVLGTGIPLWQWPYELVARHIDKTIGPLRFSFIPFLLAAWGKWKPVRYFLVLSFLYLAGGFLISYQTRLMTPEMVMLAIAAACLMARMKYETWGKLWTFLVFLFGFLICLSLARLSTDYYQSQKIWLGVQTPREFLERSPQTASFYPLAEAADLLPADDRLLIVGDARGLYYPRPYWTNSVFDDPELVTLTQKSKDAEGIGEGLQRLGVEDLVVSGEEGRRLSQLYAHAYPLTPEEWNRLDDFIQRGTDLVYVDGANGIYRIHPLQPALKPRIPDLLLSFQRLPPTSRSKNP